MDPITATVISDAEALELARRHPAEPDSPMGRFIATGEITDWHMTLANDVRHLNGATHIGWGPASRWPIRALDDYLLANGPRGPIEGRGA